VADIGLHGASRKVGDVEVPSYNLLLGGSPKPVAGDAEFGVLATRVAARLAPAAVQALAGFFVQERAPGERFRDVVLRERERVDALLAQFSEDPRPEQLDSLRIDWGQQGQFVAIKGVKGECAV
jgi:ferredoxin-nitrite reductase/sulfite reductase (ferredoxin)